MKVILCAALLNCLLLACNNPVKEVTCEEIEAMMESDQLHRLELMSLSAQIVVADSLARAKYGDEINDSYYSEFWQEATKIRESRPESDFVDVARKDSPHAVVASVTYNLILIQSYIPINIDWKSQTFQ